MTPVSTNRKSGGLGHMKIPLVSDPTRSISNDYGVLITDPADGDAGITLRGLFIIDPKGIVQQMWVPTRSAPDSSNTCTLSLCAMTCMCRLMWRVVCDVCVMQHPEQPASGPQCGRGAASGPGLPARCQARRGAVLCCSRLMGAVAEEGGGAHSTFVEPATVCW